MDQQDFDIFMAIKERFKNREIEVKELIKKIGTAEASEVVKLAAILSAVSTVHATEGQALFTERIHMVVGKAVSAIEAFTEETKASSNQMSRWTFWMMVSSGVLAVLTIVQVAIAVYSILNPDTPQILFMPK